MVWFFVGLLVGLIVGPIVIVLLMNTNQYDANFRNQLTFVIYNTMRDILICQLREFLVVFDHFRNNDIEKIKQAEEKIKQELYDLEHDEE